MISEGRSHRGPGGRWFVPQSWKLGLVRGALSRWTSQDQLSGSMLCLLKGWETRTIVAREQNLGKRYQAVLERLLRGHARRGAGSLAGREKQEEHFPAQLLADGFWDL